MSTDNRTPAQVKAAEAGAKGKSATPLTTDQRLRNYRQQNWERSGHRSLDLTDRQWRQVDRMDDRAKFRAMSGAR